MSLNRVSISSEPTEREAETLWLDLTTRRFAWSGHQTTRINRSSNSHQQKTRAGTVVGARAWAHPFSVAKSLTPPQVLLPHVFWNEGEGLHTGRLHITSADQDCCQNPRLRAFARRSLQHWSRSSHVLSNTDIYIHWLSPGISTSYQTDTSTVPDLMKLVQWWPGDNAIQGSCESSMNKT